MNIAQSTYLEWLAAEETNRQEQVQTYRAYYEGNPPTLLTDRMAAFLNLTRDKNFGANVTAIVVDTLAERLNVTGFSVQAHDEAQAKDAEAMAAQLDKWWQQNRMDGVQGWVHTAALRDAEAFVIVSYNKDEGRPELSYDFAYDGTSGVKLHCVPGTYNKTAFASKRWIVNNKGGQSTHRLNLYFPNRIEKWVNTSATNSPHAEAYWAPLQEEGLVTAELKDDEGNPYTASVAWWTEDGTETGKPLGVPVISFRNRDDGTGRGLSEIDVAIPLQDAINKCFIDLMGCADMTGFQMYWHTGEAPSGGWKVFPGALFRLLPDGDTPPSMGVLPAGDLGQLIQLWQSLIAALSGISGTPQSRFNPAAVQPAEGTQKQEEAALVAKAVRLQNAWGNAWEDVMLMAMRAEATFGKAVAQPGAEFTVSTVWDDAEVRNELNHLQALQVKSEALGVPVEQLWAEAGYSANEVRKFKAIRMRQQAAFQLAGAKKAVPARPETGPPKPNGDEPTKPEPVPYGGA